jgi:uncharacterized membrane protein
VRGHHDLRLVVAVALLCAAGALIAPLSGIRMAFAAPLCLFLPGYALASASFAGRPMDRPHFLLIALALSLSTLAAGAVVLNYAPGGITTASWVVLLLAVVGGGCWVAALRRPASRSATAPSLGLPRLAETWPLLGGLVAAIAALVLASTTLPVPDAAGHTQLWILPEPGLESTSVEVGVGNQEQTSVPYDLAVRVGDRPLVRRAFTLHPGETRVVRLTDLPGAVSRPVPVVATLLRQHHTERIEHRVKSWLPTREAH